MNRCPKCQGATHSRAVIEAGGWCTCEPYAPCVVDFDDSGFSEFVMFDRAVVYEETGAGYQVLRDMETRDIIGFAWPTKFPPKMPPHHINPETRKVTSPSPAIGDVEKLIERLRWDRASRDDIFAHLRALAAEKAKVEADLEMAENERHAASVSFANVQKSQTCIVCGGDGDEPTPPNVSRPCYNCGGTGIEKFAVRKLIDLFWRECVTDDIDIEAQRLIASLLGKFSDYHSLDWGKP